MYYLKTHYPKNLIIPEYIDFAISSLETDEDYQLEYESTTKNDLGVDCISRQAVLDLINADWKYENLEIEINNLPSVTPQEPKPMVEIDLDYVIKQKYIEREVLDKIRAEIEAKCCITVGRENDGAITLHDVFEIINKYKGESEE